MGRGIADYDHHIMIDYPDFDTAGDSAEFEKEDWLDDLRVCIGSALPKKDGEMLAKPEWDKNDDAVRVVAETPTMRIGLVEEDTYMQVVCLPKVYSRWLDENNPKAKEYDMSGNTYRNSKGACIVECEMPYSIDRAAWRFLNKLAKAMGGEPVQDYSTGERIYPNIHIRTSPWTSGALCVNGK